MSKGEDVTGIRNEPRSYHRDMNSYPEKPVTTAKSLNNVIKHQNAKHPHMASLPTRLATFRDWPQAMPQKPKELAQAGFFYLGKKKLIRFYDSISYLYS